MTPPLLAVSARKTHDDDEGGPANLCTPTLSHGAVLPSPLSQSIPPRPPPPFFCVLCRQWVYSCPNIEP